MSKLLATAIKKVESGGNYNAKGKSGEIGAYQIMPQNYVAWAKEAGVNPNDTSPQAQDTVAQHKIDQYSAKYKDPQAVAIAWNAGPGKADQYAKNGQVPDLKGTNQYGANFNVPQYAKNVTDAYKSTLKDSLKDFNQKVDQSRSKLGWSDTQILDYLGTKDPSLSQKINQSRQLYSNGTAPFKNDRDLVNFLSQKFSGQMPTVKSNEDPSQTQTKKPGMVQSFVQGLAAPFLPLAAGAQSLVEGVGNLGAAGLAKLNGNEAQVQQFEKQAADASGKQRDYGYLGKAFPVGFNQETGNRITNTGEFAKQVVGEGAQVGSFLLPGVAEEANTAKGVIPLLMKNSLLRGGTMGALMGGGSEVAKPESTIGSVLGETVKGGALGTLTDVGLGLVGQAGKGLLSLPKRAIEAVANKTGLGSLGEEVGKATKSVIAQHSGLSIDQIDHILANPDIYSKGALESATRENLLQDVKGAFETSKQKFSDTGEQYNLIRAQEKPLPVRMSANNVPDFVEKSLQDKFKIGLQTVVDKNGTPVVKLVTTKASVPLSKADRSAVEEFLNTYAKGEIKNGNEFMNARTKLSQLGNYKELGSGKTSAAERIARTLRDRYDSKGKGIYEGLRKLDSEWGPQKQLIDQWRPKLFDKQGNIKNSAYSTLANLTNKSHVEDLKLFQKLMPDIADRAKMVGVKEKIIDAAGAKPGMYSRPLTSVLSLATGHPLIALANIMSTPENFLKAMRTYGVTKQYSEPMLEQFFKNLSASKPLGARGQKILKDILEKVLINTLSTEKTSNASDEQSMMSPAFAPSIAPPTSYRTSSSLT